MMSTSNRGPNSCFAGLATKHEILHCAIGDVAVTEPALAGSVMRTDRGAGQGARVPRAHAEVHADVEELARKRDLGRRSILARSGIASVRIRDDETVIASVVTLLERQRLFGTGNR